MEKESEQFDFSKLEDQEEFEELPETKKQEHIDASHEKASKIEGDNKRLAERFGETKIDDELKEQISPYIDNKTLTIANGYLAAVVTERSERGKGIGYWDQVRVFFYDQNAMQEWNWRHKDDQHLDQKSLSVNSIGGIRASKDKDRISITIELVNNDGSRTVDFEFSAENAKPPFEDGEIPIEIAKLAEAYARKEIDKKIEYARDVDELQEMAKTSGIELTKDDFHKVVENILDVGLPEYIEKAQKVAKAGGFELTKDDYKNFVAGTDRVQFSGADGKLHSHYEDGWEIVRAIDIVAPIANFSKEDYEDIVDLILAKNKLYLEKGKAYDKSIDNAKRIAEYGKLDEEVFHKIAGAYIANAWHNKALDMSEDHNFEFTQVEFKQLADCFLEEALEYKSGMSHDLNKARELAVLAGFELNKEYVVQKYSRLIKDRPDSSELVLKELDEISKSDKKNVEQQGETFQILENVKKHALEEADRMYSFKPEMRSVESRTGNKSYEKPEITESVVDEAGERGAFVLKEQIDHDTRFPQMRYTLYFVDKSGNKREVFEKHDYIGDGLGDSIYAENDPSITELQISDEKLKFKVGGEDHEISI